MNDLVRANPPSPARRDDTVLPGTADRLRESIPANTERSYRQTWATFAIWCQQRDRKPLPTSAVLLADYVAHLCDLDRAPATIQHAMGVISAWNQGAGHPQLGKDVTKAANLILRGHRRQTGRRVKEAPPVTRDRLRAMSAACDPTTLAGKRDRLLLVTGWVLAARRSELAALRIADVQVTEDGLEILIRSSKTDKDSVGEVVHVPAGEHVDTDPVGLFRAWLSALAAVGACVDGEAAGPLFRAVTSRDTLYRHGSLSADGIHNVIRRAATRAGLPDADHYSGHSLRAGFATQAATDGIPQAYWARHGRWLPTSPVPMKYVRQADKKRDNPLRKMGL
jgi:integrase